MKFKTDDGGWNPYFAGALTGVLAIVSVYATTVLLGKGNYLGASTTFVRAAGFIERIFSSQHVTENIYFAATKIKLDWQFMLVIGIFAGSLISSLTDKSFKIEKVPPIWLERFGSSAMKRGVMAFIGGIVAMIGARMASGCPSGHGLSGMMQLSASAFVALAMFFIFGIIVARFFYNRRG
ncbi:MAG TPA: YeeE/YedE thiosulfate transporter family protein [Spirochaetota bacterium]|nr:YeeE/YedE thiosulfate transporter family protein [Spirochaetota bacterium]HPJ36155.1 YeeE/YedE thiosulfate transporter family protein [Spirochaetota bacterium]